MGEGQEQHALELTCSPPKQKDITFIKSLTDSLKRRKKQSGLNFHEQLPKAHPRSRPATRELLSLPWLKSCWPDWESTNTAACKTAHPSTTALITLSLCVTASEYVPSPIYGISCWGGGGHLHSFLALYRKNMKKGGRREGGEERKGRGTDDFVNMFITIFQIFRKSV